MPIDPELAGVLSRAPTVDWGPRLDLAALRAVRLAVARRTPSRTPLPRVWDQATPSPAVPVRIYRPSTAKSPPVTVFFHGGGFVLGGLDSYDAVARVVAEESETIVVSVDYRLAPEHPFPAAVVDAFATYQWVRDHAAELGGDPARVAVAGEAAGGNLAAVVCLMARDQAAPAPVCQVLWYPVTDFVDTPSRRENADGPLLSRAAIQWLDRQYLGRRDTDDLPAYAAPARAESLAGLPPAHIVVGRYDPLRDDGIRYAERLAADDVPTRLEVREDMAHGFLGLAQAVPACRAAAAASFATLRDGSPSASHLRR